MNHKVLELAYRLYLFHKVSKTYQEESAKEGNVLWYQEHDKRKLQEIVSDNDHHGQQLHMVL